MEKKVVTESSPIKQIGTVRIEDLQISEIKSSPMEETFTAEANFK
jgi:hypothetical protein